VLAFDEPLGALDALTRISISDCWNALAGTGFHPIW